MTMNKKDSPTLYNQLREKMRQMIINEQWKPGQKIPTEMELCEDYNVSRITVRKAVEELVNSEYLVRRQGKGTFVTNTSAAQRLSKFYSFSEELKNKGMNEYVDMLSFDVIIGDEKLSEKLSLPQGCLAYKITRLRSVDETPYSVETSYIPKDLCKELTEELISENGLYNAMRGLGVFPERAVEKFRATAIDMLSAKLLQLELNTPAIRLERLTYSGETLIEYCSSIVRGDFCVYTVELRG